MVEGRVERGDHVLELEGHHVVLDGGIGRQHGYHLDARHDLFLVHREMDLLLLEHDHLQVDECLLPDHDLGRLHRDVCRGTLRLGVGRQQQHHHQGDQGRVPCHTTFYFACSRHHFLC